MAGESKATPQGGIRAWRRHLVTAPVALMLFGGLLGSPATFADAGADEATWSHAIAWRSGETMAQPVMSLRSMAEVARAEREAGRRHVMVQFERPILESAKAALSERGLALLAPLGGSAWFARMDDALQRVDELAVVAPLRRLQPIELEWKLHPLLHGGEDVSWAMVHRHAADGLGAAPAGDDEIGEIAGREARDETPPRLAVYVMLHRGTDANEVMERVVELGGDVSRTLRSLHGMVIEMPADGVAKLAELDMVQWVEPAMPLMQPMNDLARTAIGADVLQESPFSLDGGAVTVMVYDSGTADTGHPDLAGRVTIRDSVPASQHSTHVSGIIGGSGAQSAGDLRGMAPNVQMVSYGLEPSGDGVVLYDDIGDIEEDYHDGFNVMGASVVNNSIGSNVAALGLPCSLEGDYSVMSAVVDALASGALGQSIPIVWAGGNERIFPANCGMGWRTVPPPATAKNSIVVGAIYSDFDVITTFTSYGPTDDGRIRPDVVAPGCEAGGDNGVTSANLGGGYMPLCGTSMAAPTVTGVIALLLQDHRQRAPAGLPDPSPDMLKAVLVQTAHDLWNPGPDYRHGYGAVQADKALEQLRSGNGVQGVVSQDEVWEAPVVVMPGTAKLQATLAWIDPPGTPNVGNALVNDLDLVLVGPDGEFLPWTLNPSQPGAPAVRTASDRRNPVEQVTVENPTPGIWQLQVIGYAVPMGPQSFAVTTGATIVRLEIVPTGGAAAEVDAAQTTQHEVTVTAVGQAVIAQSMRVHVRKSGEAEFVSRPMRSLGGSTYAARLPAATCGETIEYFFAGAGSLTGVVYEPVSGPDQPYVARVVNGSSTGVSHGLIEAPASSGGTTAQGDGGAQAPTDTVGPPPMQATVPIDSMVLEMNRCIGAPLVGDLDGDGAVDGIDLATLLIMWGSDDILVDLDGNWTCDGFDLAELMSHWTG